MARAAMCWPFAWDAERQIQATIASSAILKAFFALQGLRFKKASERRWIKRPMQFRIAVAHQNWDQPTIALKQRVVIGDIYALPCDRIPGLTRMLQQRFRFVTKVTGLGAEQRQVQLGGRLVGTVNRSLLYILQRYASQLTGLSINEFQHSMSNAPRLDKQTRRRLLTVYGRNAVIEALKDASLQCHTLHLASSNRRGGSLREIEALSEQRGLEQRSHSRETLARISRNGRQDQGVALDVYCPSMRELDDFLQGLQDAQTASRDGANADAQPLRLLALDGVTNPQNMGMAIRSACAGGIDGILYADRGNPAPGPLVIKASAGTVFRAPLLRCASLAQAASSLLDERFKLYRLQAGSEQTLYTENRYAQRALFVLGGETHGLSPEISSLPGDNIAIPMQNGVESLNVAVSAALLCYALRFPPSL